LRRSVRDILIFGIINYIKFFRAAKRAEHKLKFPHKLSIVAIAKNEGANFQEWIEYHRIVGVEKFYIYDNESTDDTKKVLEPYIKSGVVEYTYFPGQKMQKPAYADGLKKCRFDTKWVALIDLDEFIVPIKHEKISDYLDELPDDVGCVMVPWITYGSSGHQARPIGLVIESYKMRSADFKLGNLAADKQCKSIINPRFAIRLNGVHIGSSILKKIRSDVLRCNHYYSKSWEEFAARRSRGDVRFGNNYAQATFNKDLFDRINRDNFYDPIMDKYIPQLKTI
jgi:hypothetical protein